MPHTVIDRMVGGLRTDIPPQALGFDFWPVVEHFQFREGRAELAPGYMDFESLTGLSGTPWKIEEFLMRDGTRHLVCMTATDLFAYNTGTNTWDDLTSSIAAMTNGPGDSWMAVINDILYFGNKTNGIHKWTGSGLATLVDAAIRGSYGCAFADRLVLGNMDLAGVDYPERTRWSAAGLPEDWTNADAYIEHREVPGPITGMEPLTSEDLGVHKERGLWRDSEVGGADEIQPYFIPDVPGAQSTRLLVRGRGGHHFYVSREGVHLWDGSGAPLSVGDSVFKAVDVQSPFWSQVPWAWYNEITADFWWCFQEGHIDTGFDAMNCLVFDPKTRTWSHQYISATCACIHNTQPTPAPVAWNSITDAWDAHHRAWDDGAAGDKFTVITAGDSSVAGANHHVDYWGENWDLGGASLPGRLGSGVVNLDSEGVRMGKNRMKRITDIEIYTDSPKPREGQVTVAVHHGNTPGRLTPGNAQPLAVGDGELRAWPNITDRWFQIDIRATTSGTPLVITGLRIGWKVAGRA